MKKQYILILLSTVLFSTLTLTRFDWQKPDLTSNQLALLDNNLVIYFNQSDKEITLSKKDQEELLRFLNPAFFIQGLEKSTLFIPEACFKIFASQSTFTILFSPSGNQLKIVVKDEERIFNYDPIASSVNSFLQKWQAGLR